MNSASKTGRQLPYAVVRLQQISIIALIAASGTWLTAPAVAQKAKLTIEPMTAADTSATTIAAAKQNLLQLAVTGVIPQDLVDQAAARITPATAAAAQKLGMDAGAAAAYQALSSFGMLAPSVLDNANAALKPSSGTSVKIDPVTLAVSGGTLQQRSDSLVAFNAALVTGLVQSGQISAAVGTQLNTLVAQGAGNLVAQGAGNLVAQGAGNLVAQGAGNLVAQGAGNLVAQGAGNLVAQGAGNLVAQGAGNLVAQGAGNLVAQGAGNLVAQGAGNLVAQGAGNLVAQGAGNLVAQGAGNLVAQGAGNLVAQGAGNLVAQGAGNLVAQGAGNLVAQGAGNLVLSAAAANLIAQSAGNLVGNAGGTLIGNAGGAVVGNAGGALIGDAGGTLVGNAGGTLIGNAGGALIGDAGGTLVGNAGGALVANINANLAISGTSAVMAASAGLGGRSIMSVDDKGAVVANVLQQATALQAAAAAANMVTRDREALDLAIAQKDQSVVTQWQAKLASDAIKANVASGTLTNPADVATLGKTIATAMADTSDAAVRQKLNAAPAYVATAAQTAAATAAAATASDAANKAQASTNALAALTAQLGRTPDNPADLKKVNNQMVQNAIVAGTADVAKAEADLAAMVKAGANANAIAAQKDIIGAKFKDLAVNAARDVNDYASKAVDATVKTNAASTAQAKVDTFVQALGGNTRPSDPQALSTLNALMADAQLKKVDADRATAIRDSANLQSNLDAANVMKGAQTDQAKGLARILPSTKDVSASAIASMVAATQSNASQIQDKQTIITRDARDMAAITPTVTAAAPLLADAAVKSAMQGIVTNAQAAAASAQAVASTTQAAVTQGSGAFRQDSTTTIGGSFVDANGTIVKTPVAVTSAPNLPGATTVAQATSGPTGGGVPVSVTPVTVAPVTAATAPQMMSSAQGMLQQMTPAQVQALAAAAPALDKMTAAEQQARLGVLVPALAGSSPAQIAAMMQTTKVVASLPQEAINGYLSDIKGGADLLTAYQRSLVASGISPGTPAVATAAASAANPSGGGSPTAAAGAPTTSQTTAPTLPGAAPAVAAIASNPTGGGAPVRTLQSVEAIVPSAIVQAATSGVQAGGVTLSPAQLAQVASAAQSALKSLSGDQVQALANAVPKLGQLDAAQVQQVIALAKTPEGLAIATSLIKDPVLKAEIVAAAPLLSSLSKLSDDQVGKVVALAKTASQLPPDAVKTVLNDVRSGMGVADVASVATAVVGSASATQKMNDLVARYGSRPDDAAQLAQVNAAMAQAGLSNYQLNLAQAKGDLATMVASGASAAAIATQKDLVSARFKDAAVTDALVKNGYSDAQVAAQSAAAAAANAQTKLDGFMKTLPAGQPADAQQAATLKALTGDAQLAKAQSDLAAADTNAKRMNAQVQAANAMSSAGTAAGLTPAAIAAQQTTASNLSGQIQAATTTINADRAQIASLTAAAAPTAPTLPTAAAAPTPSGNGAFVQSSTTTLSSSAVDQNTGRLITSGTATTSNPTGGGAPVAPAQIALAPTATPAPVVVVPPPLPATTAEAAPQMLATSQNVLSNLNATQIQAFASVVPQLDKIGANNVNLLVANAGSPQALASAVDKLDLSATEKQQILRMAPALAQVTPDQVASVMQTTKVAASLPPAQIAQYLTDVKGGSDPLTALQKSMGAPSAAATQTSIARPAVTVASAIPAQTPPLSIGNSSFQQGSTTTLSSSAVDQNTGRFITSGTATTSNPTGGGAPVAPAQVALAPTATPAPVVVVPPPLPATTAEAAPQMLATSQNVLSNLNATQIQAFASVVPQLDKIGANNVNLLVANAGSPQALASAVDKLDLSATEKQQILRMAPALAQVTPDQVASVMQTTKVAASLPPAQIAQYLTEVKGGSDPMTALQKSMGAPSAANPSVGGSPAIVAATAPVTTAQTAAPTLPTAMPTAVAAVASNPTGGGAPVRTLQSVGSGTSTTNLDLNPTQLAQVASAAQSALKSLSPDQVQALATAVPKLGQLDAAQAQQFVALAKTPEGLNMAASLIKDPALKAELLAAAPLLSSLSKLSDDQVSKVVALTKTASQLPTDSVKLVLNDVRGGMNVTDVANVATAVVGAASATQKMNDLVARNGSRPDDPQKLAEVNAAMAQAGLNAYKLNLAQAKGDLATMVASNASASTIAAQKDLVSVRFKDAAVTEALVKSGYSDAQVTAQTAAATATNAQSKLDGFVKTMPGGQPADAQQAATLKALTSDAQVSKAQSELAAADVNARRMSAQVQAANDMKSAGTAAGLTPAAIAAQQTTANGLTGQIQAANATIASDKAQIAKLTTPISPLASATPTLSTGMKAATAAAAATMAVPIIAKAVTGTTMTKAVPPAPRPIAVIQPAKVGPAPIRPAALPVKQAIVQPVKVTPRMATPAKIAPVKALAPAVPLKRAVAPAPVRAVAPAPVRAVAPAPVRAAVAASAPKPVAPVGPPSSMSALGRK